MRSRRASWRFGFVALYIHELHIRVSRRVYSVQSFLPGVAKASRFYTFGKGQALMDMNYYHLCCFFLHSLVSLNVSISFFHTALENKIGITGYSISSSAKPLSRLCGRRGAVFITFLDVCALLARSAFNQAVDSDTWRLYCPRVYLPTYVMFSLLDKPEIRNRIAFWSSFYTKCILLSLSHKNLCVLVLGGVLGGLWATGRSYSFYVHTVHIQCGQ